jgi:hypothetical protein
LQLASVYQELDCANSSLRMISLCVIIWTYRGHEDTNASYSAMCKKLICSILVIDLRRRCAVRRLCAYTAFRFLGLLNFRITHNGHSASRPFLRLRHRQWSKILMVHNYTVQHDTEQGLDSASRYSAMVTITKIFDWDMTLLSIRLGFTKEDLARCRQ